MTTNKDALDALAYLEEQFSFDMSAKDFEAVEKIRKALQNALEIVKENG